MLLSYFKRHYKIIFMFAAFSAIFAVIFSLYNLEVEAVVYACILCLFLGLIGFAFSYLSYCDKHRKLCDLLCRLDTGLEGLPDPKGLIESDYQSIACELYSQGLRHRSQMDSAIRDMEDYYTLWAHQIKTPIFAMHLLLENENSREAKLLQAELFKTEQYVDMVLQYVRLGSESSDLLLKKLDLDKLIRACLRKYAQLFSLKELEFSFEPTQLTVLSDEKWLTFVIEQIFSNSLKYTNIGKISIYANGETLVIEDTGIGIRAEDLPRVCEKGYTGATGRSDKQSTGIGLSLCKGILTKLGHSFQIESELGVGTKAKIGLERPDTTFE